jgi:hypothetical protein
MANDSLYKSRLFNFLNRQAIRGRDRLARTARYLQVAVLWSAQILVYPVYLLVQTGRTLGRKLEANREPERATGSLPPESAPFPAMTSDAPIVLVLAVGIQLFQSATETGSLTKREPPNSSAIAPPQGEASISPPETAAITIQGIASDLTTRKIVLVGPNHQIFDLLTPEQDAQLQRRIVWEIANLNRHRRALQESFLALRVPSDAASDERVLPPARWFWRTMGWVQQGTVARAIDLFGESIWVQSSPKEEALQLNLPLHLPAILSWPSFSTLVAPLDRAIARAETQFAAIPLEDMKATFPFLRQLERAPSMLPLQNFPPFVFLDTQLQNLPDSDRGTLQALIRAAIDYFFGDREQDRVAPVPDLAELPASFQTVADAEKGDLWLSWEDLYSQDSTDVFWDSSPRDRTAVNALPSAAFNPPLNNAPRFRPRSSTQPPLSKRPRPRFRSAPAQPLMGPELGAFEAKSPSSAAAIATTSSASSLTENPIADWLDIDATPAGYVKHPLEQILEWLDRIMLGFEEVLLTLWRWIYRRIP